jgi:hypothetical protein
MAHPYEWRDEREDRGRRYDEVQEPRDARRAMEADADRLGRGLKRGWRRLSEDVRRAFDEDRPGSYDSDPRRGGGMFGGQDRPDSLFSHDYRGKGPRGYVRSDARILEDVSDRLADDDRLDASDIEVKVEAGEVTLNGQVRSREDKRRAEDLAERVSGVKHLQNNLRVKPAEAVAAETQRSASMAGAAVGATQPIPPPRRG